MKKKLRVAVIVHGGVNAGHEGQGVPSLVALLKGLHLKVDLTIYSLAKLEVTNELSVKYVPGIGRSKFASLAFLFAKDHLKKSYDIVQAFWGFPSGVLANFLSGFFSIPSIVTLMGGETASLPDIHYGSIRHKQGKRKVFQLLKKANAVIAISNYQIEFLKKAGFERKANFYVIPFGVLRIGNARELPGRENLKIAHVANINRIKDHKTSINAVRTVLKRLDVRLTIAGGDFMGGEIHKYVQDEGLDDKVRFTGVLNNEEVLELIKDSDLVLMSSRSEGQAVVFNEAMAVGVPFCGTDVGLMQDLSGECCLTSLPGDHEGLANNIVKILTDESLYRTLSQNGIAWTIDNDLNTTVSKYLKVYKTLAEK